MEASSYDEAGKDLNHFIFATLGPIWWLGSIRLRPNIISLSLGTAEYG